MRRGAARQRAAGQRIRNGRESMEEMLRADNITFSYTDDQHRAVDGLSLRVKRGEYVAVLGANGCGKSTLAKHFNAILLPQAGTVYVEDMSTADEDKLFDIRQKVGMVFQNPDNQIVATVVEEDVAFALENLGVPPAEMRARVDEAMQMAGIYKYREKGPHKLSGGQKQRVAIAGVIAMRPDCLVLDEATAMLDPIGREKVMRTVHRLNDDYGITVVQITHYMEEAATADRVVVMSAGRVVMEGTPKEVFRNVEELRALHLDVPQAAAYRKKSARSRTGKSRGGVRMSAIVKVEDLTYIYNQGMPDETVALDHVSFEIEEGEFVGVIGSTGCGKSTLITHFNGINKPTSGKVYIAGEDMWADPKDIRRFRFMAGLVFQYPEYQLFEETVYKDIAFGPANMGLSAEEIDRRVQRAAAFCGIDSCFLQRSPFELSGGQKRRVAIAGVLAMEPRLLVLDEPAAGLDPEGRDMILGQIREYHKQTGSTIVLVSHSMEDIAKYADRVLVMNAGRIAMYDATDKVFARAPELLELGLSVPEVTKIFLRLREMGLDIDTDVYTVKYAVKTILAARAAAKEGM